jgi:hypothetical protein
VASYGTGALLRRYLSTSRDREKIHERSLDMIPAVNNGEVSGRLPVDRQRDERDFSLKK